MANRTEIPIPEGFKPPSAEDGSSKFEVVDTWEVSADGKMLCLVQLGDHKMPGYSDKTDEEQPTGKPGYSNMAETMMSQAPAGAGGY